MSNLPTSNELETMGWDFHNARIFSKGQKLDRGGGIHEPDCKCTICTKITERLVDMVVLNSYKIVSCSLSFEEYIKRNQ